MFQAGLLVHPNHLRGAGRIQRLDLFRRARPLATDDELILVTEHIAHTGKRGLHGMHVCRVAEIDERFVAEQPLRGDWLNNGADLCGWHNKDNFTLVFIGWR